MQYEPPCSWQMAMQHPPDLAVLANAPQAPCPPPAAQPSPHPSRQVSPHGHRVLHPPQERTGEPGQGAGVRCDTQAKGGDNSMQQFQNASGEDRGTLLGSGGSNGTWGRGQGSGARGLGNGQGQGAPWAGH